MELDDNQQRIYRKFKSTIAPFVEQRLKDYPEEKNNDWRIKAYFNVEVLAEIIRDQFDNDWDKFEKRLNMVAAPKIQTIHLAEQELTMLSKAAKLARKRKPPYDLPDDDSDDQPQRGRG